VIVTLAGRMRKRAGAFVFMLAAWACSDENSATAPSRRPSPTPTANSLSGQITDSMTGTGISGARVSIPSGRNGGYAPQTKSVTFTSTPSDQTLSFRLVRANGIISFNGLAGSIGSAVSTYTESGFTVSAMAGSWTVDAYGNPGPSVIFTAPAGTTVTGRMQVTAGGGTFAFTSIELYTFGNFATVVNPQAADVIDTLVISLTNASAPCCSNPMGVDNIAVSR
jgi:hypothetical protein